MKKLHPRAVWLFFLNSIFVWLFVIFIFSIYIFSIYTDIKGPVEEGFFSGFPNWFWPTIIAFIVLLFIWAKLTYYFYRYDLSDEGFKKEHGVIWKKYVTIPYSRIQNVDIYRGILARVLGLSDLHIQTAGLSAGSGRFTEGRLPGLSKEEAELLRNELIRRVNEFRSQGL